MAFIKGTKKVALALIAMLATQTIISVQSAEQTDDIGVYPGIAIRLEQETFDAFKVAMQKFLPKYIEHDAKLPYDYYYQIGMEAGFLTDMLTWKYHWSDIKYSDARFDFRDVKLILNNELGVQMLKVDFPALKEWKINALQTTNSWFMPDQSHVELEFNNFDVNFNTELELMDTGFLKPVVYQIEIKFGKSDFYHENALIAFIMNQFVEFAIVVIENSSYFVGQYIFTSLLGPMLTKFLNEYKMNIILLDMLPGQDSSDKFVLDYKHTHRPYIGDGYIDMFMEGNLLFQDQACDLKPGPMNFMDNQKFSQLVISEAAMACYLTQISKSKIGILDLNEDRFNQLFGLTGVPFTTQSIYEHLPLFQNKLGQDSQGMPLKVLLTYGDVEVLFGQYDTDVIVKYKLHIGFHIDGGKELLYDEIHMISSFDIEARNDVVYVKVLNNKINNRSDRKKAPIRNTMDMTESEYREFISTFGFTMNYMKKWLNDVYFRQGIKFPYKAEELETELLFQENSMHVMLEVNNQAADFFERDFWTDKDWEY